MAQATTQAAEPSPPFSLKHGKRRFGTQASAWPRDGLRKRFASTRAFTTRLCKPLATEDYVIQTMADVSPAKWHLAHTSWFYERFILQEHLPGYRPYRESYYYLFNSYYNAVGPMHCRPNRGLISRPTVEQVYDYRAYVDQRIVDLIDHADAAAFERIAPLVVLGSHHEQQHQELMVTDLKHIFSSNPLLPAYHEAAKATADRRQAPPSDPSPGWRAFEGGVHEIGCDAADTAFCFDNETPRHKHYLQPFALASRTATNGEYQAFIEDGGYERPELWLSAGWATIQESGWRHPIYWYRDPDRPDGWMHYTLFGPRPVDPAEPASHLSYFEADAYARWRGCRLPTEAEWETAAEAATASGRFAEDRLFHPRALDPAAAPAQGGRDGEEAPDAERQDLKQMFGNVWEWTASHYSPYPGYRPLSGALGEYNGKFMCNQFVLRGGSCATSRSHIRRTYRNFFAPDARWQFTGLRLARDE